MARRHKLTPSCNTSKRSRHNSKPSNRPSNSFRISRWEAVPTRASRCLWFLTACPACNSLAKIPWQVSSLDRVNNLGNLASRKVSSSLANSRGSRTKDSQVKHRHQARKANRTTPKRSKRRSSHLKPARQHPQEPRLRLRLQRKFPNKLRPPAPSLRVSLSSTPTWLLNRVTPR